MGVVFINFVALAATGLTLDPKAAVEENLSLETAGAFFGPRLSPAIGKRVGPRYIIYVCGVSQKLCSISRDRPEWV